MKLGKVIGRVVSTTNLECFEGIILLLVQPLDEHLNEIGTAIVAMDTVKAGENEIIMYEQSKEAGQALDNWFHPGDTAIVGIVDQINGIEKKDSGK